MIYFVQLDSGSIKIGTTENLGPRLAQIAWERGTDVTVLATLPGGREEEQQIHERFAHLRLGRTEQFKPAKELLEFIGNPLLVSSNPETIEVQPLSTATTIQKAIRLTPPTVAQAHELARFWGPIKPLSLADVVAECIKRVHDQESKKKEKRS